eukprot:scaffold84764_cov17-Tisochrysis_lutea.AAC.1
MIKYKLFRIASQCAFIWIGVDENELTMIVDSLLKDGIAMSLHMYWCGLMRTDINPLARLLSLSAPCVVSTECGSTCNPSTWELKQGSAMLKDSGAAFTLALTADVQSYD